MRHRGAGGGRSQSSHSGVAEQVEDLDRCLAGLDQLGGEIPVGGSLGEQPQVAPGCGHHPRNADHMKERGARAAVGAGVVEIPALR